MDLVQLLWSLAATFLMAFIASRMFPASEKLTCERIVRNVSRYCPEIDFAADRAGIFLSSTGKAAVLFFPDARNGLAIATAVGDRVVVRHITDPSSISVKPSAGKVVLSLADFTQPSVSLALAEEDQAAFLSRLHSFPKQKELAHA